MRHDTVRCGCSNMLNKLHPLGNLTWLQNLVDKHEAAYHPANCSRPLLTVDDASVLLRAM